MGDIKNYSPLDWLFMAQFLVVWLFFAVKAWEWIFQITIRKGYRWWYRRDKKQVALADFFAAFDLDAVKKDNSITIRTEGGLIIHVWRKGDDNA